MESEYKSRLGNTDMTNLKLKSHVKQYQEENDELKETINSLEEKFNLLTEESNKLKINQQT